MLLELPSLPANVIYVFPFTSNCLRIIEYRLADYVRDLFLVCCYMDCAEPHILLFRRPLSFAQQQQPAKHA